MVFWVNAQFDQMIILLREGKNLIIHTSMLDDHSDLLMEAVIAGRVLQYYQKAKAGELRNYASNFNRNRRGTLGIERKKT